MSNGQLSLVDTSSAKFECGGDVLWLEIRIVGQYLIASSSRSKLPKHHSYCHPEVSDAGQSPPCDQD